MLRFVVVNCRNVFYIFFYHVTWYHFYFKYKNVLFKYIHINPFLNKTSTFTYHFMTFVDKNQCDSNFCKHRNQPATHDYSAHDHLIQYANNVNKLFKFHEVLCKKPDVLLHNYHLFYSQHIHWCLDILQVKNYCYVSYMHEIGKQQDVLYVPCSCEFVTSKGTVS